MTNDAFKEVQAERDRQDARWGEQNHPLADDVLRKRFGGCDAERMAEEYEIPTSDRAKFMCETAAERGQCTWAHILIEEVAEFVEAAAHGDVEHAREELIQIAAVAIQAAQAIDRGVTK